MSRGIRVLLGLVVLGLVLLTVDPTAAWRLLVRADPWLVGFGVVGLTVVHVVAASAWWSMLRIAAGVELPWRRAVATFYAAQAIGGVTPANVGGDLHRAVTLRGAGLGWGAAVAPLIVQRATSYLALALLAVAAIVVLAPMSDLPLPMVAIGGGTAVLISLAAWLVLSPPAVATGLRSWFVRRVDGAGGSDARLADGLGRSAVVGLASGLVFHALSIGLTFTLILALDPDIPALPALAALTVGRLSLAVPITPSGLGVQEGALAVLFGTIGLSPETAVAGLLLGRLALVSTTVVGAVLLARAGRMPLDVVRRAS